MRWSEGVEWCIHVCTVLALLPEDRALTAGRLAEFHGVPAPYLGKQLQALSKAGIVASTPGRRGGYRLTRAADEITLLDVVSAVEGTAPVFRCTEIRRRGPAATSAGRYALPCGVARAMWAAEEAYRAELARRTVADLVAGLHTDVPAESQEKAVAWFEEVLRP